MARPHRRALAFLGFWVRRLLGQRGGIDTASAGSLQNGIASLQGSSEPCAVREAVPGRMARLIVTLLSALLVEIIGAALTRHGGFSPTISRVLRAGPSLYQVQSSLGYLCRTPGR